MSTQEEGKVVERSFRLMHFGGGNTSARAVGSTIGDDPRALLEPGKTGLFIAQPQVPYRITSAHSGAEGVNVTRVTRPLIADPPDWSTRLSEMPALQISEILGIYVRNDTELAQRVAPWFDGVGIQDENPQHGDLERKHWIAHFLLGTLPYAVELSHKFMVKKPDEEGAYRVLKAHLPAAGRIKHIDVQLSNPAASRHIVCTNVICGRTPGVASADSVPLDALRGFDFSRTFGPLAVSQVLSLALINCAGEDLEAEIHVDMLVPNPDIITPEHAELR